MTFGRTSDSGGPSRPTEMRFITGTGTGVGKTVLCALLLAHLRESGVRALAVKPISSGRRADAKLLFELQEHELPLDEVNPVHFSEPIAPLPAARRHRRVIRLAEILTAIRRAESRCDFLVVEGTGGLLSPLGEGFSSADVLRRMGCPAIVVGWNRLGVINDVRMTLWCMESVGVEMVKVVLMEPRSPDPSIPTNGQILQEIIRPVPVFTLPFLGSHASGIRASRTRAKMLKKVLARIIACRILRLRSF